MISGVKQAIIDLNVVIERTVGYQLIQGVYNMFYFYYYKFAQILNL